MNQKLSVHPEARDELREAILYYRDTSTSIAMEFVEIYEAAIATILKSPRSSPLMIDEFRRKVLHKFPFSIFYTLAGAEIRILAIAHQKREPYYWFGRS